MEICGQSIVESRVVLAGVAASGLLLLAALTGLGMWFDGHLERVKQRPKIVERAQERQREEEPEDD